LLPLAHIWAAHPSTSPKRAIFLRLGQKMNRNTHAFPLPDNDQITLAPYSCIRRAGTKTLVLILPAVDESRDLSNALEAGAAGYVLKDAPAARITDAVRRVLSGDSPLDEKVAMGLL
jgi:DNA-binding NarL/FixJ family response regulator